MLLVLLLLLLLPPLLLLWFFKRQIIPVSSYWGLRLPKHLTTIKVKFLLSQNNIIPPVHVSTEDLPTQLFWDLVDGSICHCSEVVGHIRLFNVSAQTSSHCPNVTTFPFSYRNYHVSTCVISQRSRYHYRTMVDISAASMPKNVGSKLRHWWLLLLFMR